MNEEINQEIVEETVVSDEETLVTESETVEDSSIETVEQQIVENEEKGFEKVEEKKNTRKNKQSKSTKECPVVCYNRIKHFMIISFNGINIRIDGIVEKPNDTVEVKYSGEIGTPSFKLEVK